MDGPPHSPVCERERRRELNFLDLTGVLGWRSWTVLLLSLLVSLLWRWGPCPGSTDQRLSRQVGTWIRLAIASTLEGNPLASIQQPLCVVEPGMVAERSSTSTTTKVTSKDVPLLPRHEQLCICSTISTLPLISAPPPQGLRPMFM